MLPKMIMLLYFGPKQERKGTTWRTLPRATLAMSLAWHQQARHKRQKEFSPQLFQEDTNLLRKYEASDCTQVSCGHHCARLRTAIGWYEIIRLVISVTQKGKKAYLEPLHNHIWSINTYWKQAASQSPAQSWEFRYPQVGITEDSTQPVEELRGAAGCLWLSPELTALQHWALHISHCTQGYFWPMLLNLVFGEVWHHRWFFCTWKHTM